MNRREMIAGLAVTPLGLSLPPQSVGKAGKDNKGTAADRERQFVMSDDAQKLFDFFESLRQEKKYFRGIDNIFWSVQPNTGCDITTAYQTTVDYRFSDNEDFEPTFYQLPQGSYSMLGYVKQVDVVRSLYEYFKKYYPKNNPITKWYLQTHNLINIDYMQMLIDQTSKMV